ncbi:hypothetical protein D7V83_17820 [bacterium 0.1xD8-71]|nr:hypothetical protein D7V83_17820 [bacterium 0.1xD8-71]
MSEMERYRDMYFEDCVELLKNKHSYRKHVDKFIDYLKKAGLENRPRVIDKKVVEDCIGYYRLERGELNTRSTMEAHLEALKSFYDYLSRTDKLPDIFTDYDYKEYKEEIVKKYELSEPVERGSFKCEEIIEILAAMEKLMEQSLEEGFGLRDEERYLQRIIMRLFIKITLIAPAKRNIIGQIKMNDFEGNFKILNINKIKINIPCGLSRDIIQAIQYAECKNGKRAGKTDKIFEFIYRHKGKFTDESLNTWFLNLLQDIGYIEKTKRRTYPVEPIRNGAISIMVNNMVNPLLISKITGIGFSRLETQYYGTMKSEYKDYLDKNINKAIAQNEYYSYI